MKKKKKIGSNKFEKIINGGEEAVWDWNKDWEGYEKNQNINKKSDNY